MLVRGHGARQAVRFVNAALHFVGFFAEPDLATVHERDEDTAVAITIKPTDSAHKDRAGMARLLRELESHQNRETNGA